MLPEPKSLKMPARMDLATNSFASVSVMFSLKSASNTAIAANEPDPIVANGRESLLPCGCTLKRCGPLMSTPPSTSAAPTCPWYLNRCVLSMVSAVTTRDLRLVARRWSSSADAIMPVDEGRSRDAFGSVG